MSVDPQQGTRAPQKPPQHPGWRVDPPGRGTPQKPHWSRLGWRLVLLAVILFGFNYWAASRATKHQPRVRVPYSPFFVQAVRAGNVAQITSRGTAVQGQLKQSVDYGNKHARLFKTEIPAFADTNALSQLLQRKGVVVNAVPLDTGAPWWESLLVGFGPTILFIALIFFAMRRAGSMQNILGQFGRSRRSNRNALSANTLHST